MVPASCPTLPLEEPARREKSRPHKGTTLAPRLAYKTVDMTAEVRKPITDAVALSPRQIARIRGQIATHVRALMPQAVEAARGERTWSNQQVTLFRTLLAKVVPDLSQSHSTVDITTRTINELTREELEAIASGNDALDGEIVDTIERVDDDDALVRGARKTKKQ